MKLTDKKLDAMIVEIISAADSDLGKSFDPECSELTKEEIKRELASLRTIVLRHLRLL